MWQPSVRVTRRAAARMLIAHRGGGIQARTEEVIACIDAISHAHLSTKLCRLVGKMWLYYGYTVSDWETGNPTKLRANAQADDTLDSVIRKVG